MKSVLIALLGSLATTPAPTIGPVSVVELLVTPSHALTLAQATEPAAPTRRRRAPAAESQQQPATQQPARPRREATPGQLAARERMRACGAEWRQMRQQNRVAQGQTWRTFSSECLRRRRST